MSERNTTVTISIDLKKYRLRIHKYTLGLLGIPNYVQLLVNPKGMQIALIGQETNTRDAHKVNLKCLQPDNSFELYSKALIVQLCRLVPGLDLGCTYRLTGTVLHNKTIAVFPLSTLQKIEGLEEQ